MHGEIHISISLTKTIPADRACVSWTMSFGPKHQRKVNECYPMKPGEEGPVPGKINLLTFYINARPEKLLKVSAYLEKKVIKDVQRERTGYTIIKYT